MGSIHIPHWNKSPYVVELIPIVELIPEVELIPLLELIPTKSRFPVIPIPTPLVVIPIPIPVKYGIIPPLKPTAEPANEL